ncbi:class I SAM-dependent methyltransferase [soil metagenome]
MIYNAPDLYDAQYAHYRDDLAFYTRLADDYGGSGIENQVLELGAGTGRVTAALARAGHEVVAVDLSGAMLARAEMRLKEAGLLERVTLVQADMRTVKLDRNFPLVIAPFNTLMHLYTLADQDAALAAVKRHLAPRGAFALDLYNVFEPNLGATDVVRREPEWREVGGANADLFLVQHHDRDEQVLESRYYLDTVGDDGGLTRQTAVLKQRYYTRFELERALSQAGFTHLQIYGSFDKRRYNHDAPHLVVVAR